MTEPLAPLVELAGVVKQGPGLPTLRIGRLAIARGDRVVLAGLDAAGAEAFVHLVTGALLPDEGDVRVAGRSTRDIATDTEWLASLDCFGLVTDRAVLLDAMPVAANLALPVTLAIDPMPDEVRRRVEAMADEVSLGRDRLRAPAATLTAIERAHVHLARALAVEPRVLLLEQPAARLDPAGAGAFGATLRRVAEARDLAWIALTNDREFARASGGTLLQLRADGEIVQEGFWRTLWTRRAR